MGDNNKKKKKGEERVVVMEKEVIEIDLSYSPLDDKDEGETGTPVRPIFCLKNKLEIKEFEEKEDCFILEFDPNETLDLSTLSVLDHHDGDHSPDLSVLAEKGQVLFLFFLFLFLCTFFFFLNLENLGFLEFVFLVVTSFCFVENGFSWILFLSDYYWSNYLMLVLLMKYY